MTILAKIKATNEMTESETKPGRDRSRLGDHGQTQSSTMSK